MSCMSGSPNLNSFRDRGQVAVQLVSCGVLLPGLVWSLWCCFVLLLEGIQFLSSFPFLSHVQVFSCEISLVCRLKYPYSCFSSHFCFLVIFVLLMFVLSVLFQVIVNSLPRRFLCSLLVIVSMHRRSLECWQVLFLLIFLTRTVCLRHRWDVRPYASSWVFPFSISFLEVLFPL